MQNYNSQGNYSNEETSGMAIASMILGIVSILMSFCVYPLSIICSILAIIFCLAHDKNKKGKGMAVAGMVCGIVALIPAVIMATSGAALLSSIM